MAAIPTKVYVDDVGTVIRIDVKETITGATGLSFVVKKPDKSIVVWTPTIDGTTKLRYVTVSGDLNVAGVYVIQPRLTLSGWTGRGNSVELTVYSHYE